MQKIILYLILSTIPFIAYAKDADIPKDTAIPNASLASTNESVNTYVNQLVHDGLDILDDTTTTQEVKIAKTKKLIFANLDLQWMARFTLGGYRKTLTPEQLNKFTTVYSNYVTKAYADLVKNYHGQKPSAFEVRSVDKGEFEVEMLIGEVRVRYRVHQLAHLNDKNNFKVSDVITEGVSLIQSQQAEFMNILSNRGFDALVEELLSKS